MDTKEKNIKGVLIKTDTPPQVITVENDYKGFCGVLEVNLIDIVNLELQGKRYDFIVDDEALLKQPVLVTGLNAAEGQPMLTGNLLIVNVNEETGVEESLTNEDISNIYKNIVMLKERITDPGTQPRTWAAVNNLKW